MNDAVCTLFNNKEFEKLNLCCWLKIKYHNPSNLTFQHLPIKDRIQIPYKNNTYEYINRSRNGTIVSTLTHIDIVQIVRTGGVVLKVYEGFFCESLEYNPYKDFVFDMFRKRNEYKSKGNDLLAKLIKKFACSVYGNNVRRDVLDKYMCVGGEWLDREYDKSIKETIPLENEAYIVKNTYMKL